VPSLAEGAGKHSKPGKRRYYRTARGSATESAALGRVELDFLELGSEAARETVDGRELRVQERRAGGHELAEPTPARELMTNEALALFDGEGRELRRRVRKQRGEWLERLVRKAARL
jgi:hypothetical protein